MMFLVKFLFSTLFLRYLGNILLVVGYFLILNVNIEYGLVLRIISGTILFPIFIFMKMWDVTFKVLIFFIMDTIKFIMIF